MFIHVPYFNQKVYLQEMLGDFCNFCMGGSIWDESTSAQVRDGGGKCPAFACKRRLSSSSLKCQSCSVTVGWHGYLNLNDTQMDSCAAMKAAAAPPVSAGWHLCWLTCSAQVVEPSASLAHFHPSDRTVMKTLSTWQQVVINMEGLDLIDGIKEKQHLCFLSRKLQATCDILNFKI